MVPLVSLSLGLHGGIDRGVSWIHQLVVQLLAGEAVSMEQFVEVPYNLGLEVCGANGFPSNHTLDSLPYLANNPGELSCIGQPGALEVLHGDVQLHHKIQVYIVLRYLGQVGRACDGEWLPLANKDEVLDGRFHVVQYFPAGSTNQDKMSVKREMPVIGWVLSATQDVPSCTGLVFLPGSCLCWFTR